MVAGHLQVKKGYFYIVISYKDDANKSKTKWIATKLPVKGNKKRAENMLLEARQCFEADNQSVEADILFSAYMNKWLEMVRGNIEETTYAGYANNVKTRIVPYFKSHKIKLRDLQPRHIQDFYTYAMNNYNVCTNTVLRYHANIRKALAYAVKTDLIIRNPADLIDRPKSRKFVGSFYDKEEMNDLLAAVKGSKIELAVMLAAFYGLRRSEVLGLKWDAINFENNTFTIQNIVTQVTVEGENKVIIKNRTKNKSSHRTLPLVPKIAEYLKTHLENEKQYRNVCRNCYNDKYIGYLNVDKMGNLLKPDYISGRFRQILDKNDLRRIRFHDLRHSCASLLLSNGVSMKEIQEWLGHSDFGTTANIYVHLEFSQKIVSANTMSNLLAI